MTSLAALALSGKSGIAGLGRHAAPAVLGLIAAAQLVNVFHREANWDEFHFLALVFEHQRGELHLALQTFHVHLFAWLTALPTDELGMIVAGRAAAARVHGLTVVTRNVKDFDGRGVTLLDPFKAPRESRVACLRAANGPQFDRSGLGRHVLDPSQQMPSFLGDSRPRQAWLNDADTELVPIVLPALSASR